MITNYLKATNFGFSIPSGSTISGIKVEIEQKASAVDSIQESSVKIVKADGTIGTTNKSTSASLPTSEAYVTYGGGSDLWGETWSDTDINDTDFGVAFSVTGNGTASIDHIRITVYYAKSVTSFASPQTMADSDAVGDTAWLNPDNAKANDGSHTTLSSEFSVPITGHYLKATNFGFSIPNGATIDGIEVQIEERDGADTGEITDNAVRIVKADGSIGTTDRSKVAPWEGTTAYTTYGGSSDLWGETWSTSDINDADFGVALSVVVNEILSSAQVDHIQIRIYYTESGTDANSERGLYIKGSIDPLYSRESSASLGADDTNLTNIFTTQDYTDVGTDDDNYVDLQGIAQYFQFLFKESNENNNNTDDFRITWKGKSSLAPSSSAVSLQIYNRTTTEWTTLASNNSANANTKFTLTYDVSTDLSDYYDNDYIISARVYQDGVV